jgi:hypothetical protein
MELRRQRIHEASRVGLRNRLLEEWRLPTDETDRLLAAWEEEAAARGLRPGDFGYWRDADDWIRARARR